MYIVTVSIYYIDKLCFNKIYVFCWLGRYECRVNNKDLNPTYAQFHLVFVQSVKRKGVEL
jgi:hypothetical protein